MLRTKPKTNAGDIIFSFLSAKPKEYISQDRLYNAIRPMLTIAYPREEYSSFVKGLMDLSDVVNIVKEWRKDSPEYPGCYYWAHLGLSDKDAEGIVHDRKLFFPEDFPTIKY